MLGTIKVNNDKYDPEAFYLVGLERVQIKSEMQAWPGGQWDGSPREGMPCGIFVTSGATANPAVSLITATVGVAAFIHKILCHTVSARHY